MKTSSILPLLVALGIVACDPKTGPVAQSSTAPVNTSATPPSTTTATAAQTSTATKVDPPPMNEIQKLAEGSNAFGFDLYARYQKQGGNFIVSPASITTALAMTYGGAKGETAAQMKKVLHLEGDADATMATAGKLAQSLQDPSRPVVFRIANQLFGEQSYTLEPSFLDKTKTHFGAPLEKVDFRTAFEPARAKINGWVEQKTEKKIADLIPKGGVDAETRLVLVNAIYFLGDWQTPFKKESTQPMDFSLGKDAKKSVPTMNLNASFKTGKTEAMTAIELPYKGGQMSMMIVMPNTVDGLSKLESGLDAQKLAGIASSLSMVDVNLSLPKFEVKPSASITLGADLKAMGMPLAFDRQKADFTGIANPPNPADRPVIGEVFHKGFVKVDEKGTEAAAATAVVMSRAGSAARPSEPVEVKVDRPFFFVIKDNASGLVLFMGRVNDPSKT